MLVVRVASVLLFLISTAALSQGQESGIRPPVIPVGADAYLQWDKWPQHRIGARAYMRCTYDRAGANEQADASHFLYQTRDDFNVTLDVEGKGYVYFVRFNHWHGSPWHFEVNGNDHIVKETTTDDPTKKLKGAKFIPEKPFPTPLCYTYATTQGADLIWSPMGFTDRFRMAYSRTYYGTGYYIYHLFAPGAQLSSDVDVWNEQTTPDQAVLDLLNSAGTDIAPKDSVEETTASPVKLTAGGAVEVANLSGAQSIRAIKLTAPRDQALRLGRARIRITWDGRDAPSVDAPIAQFFGSGTLHNKNDQEYLVKALPMNIRFDKENVHLACYFPMPFFKSAKVELVGGEQSVDGVQCVVRSEPNNARREHVGYFHATYKDHTDAKLGLDLVLVDTDKVEGGGPWAGNFVGTSFIFSDRANLRTLEGDPRFFFDDSLTPQAQGTGTEEWGGGGDYWGGRTMTLPLAGHPVGVRRAKDAEIEEELIQSAYRYLLADLMPFGRRAVIHLEHGGSNQSTEHYQSVAYWYGAPYATLVKTDTIDVGDADSETAHAYRSPKASDPYTFTSRYEWGVSHVKDGKDSKGKTKRREVYPTYTKTGRKTTGSSEFTLDLNKDNWGVVLRRTLDYQFPNQRAKVFVADAGAEEPDWQDAGVWYLAGSNTCFFSYPGRSGKNRYRDRARGELSGTEPVVQTSDRRLRDDEFLIGQGLTRGRNKIRVRVEYTPMDIPVLPDMEVGEQAWSEIAYDCYCYVLPKLDEE